MEMSPQWSNQDYMGAYPDVASRQAANTGTSSFQGGWQPQGMDWGGILRAVGGMNTQQEQQYQPRSFQTSGSRIMMPSMMPRQGSAGMGGGMGMPGMQPGFEDFIHLIQMLGPMMYGNQQNMGRGY